MCASKATFIEEEGCRVRVVHLDRVTRARHESISPKVTDRLARTYKALGDPTRLKILMALMGGEMCVCDLSAFLGLSESAVSHQLRYLKDLALVRNRRDGQILYYALDDDHVSVLLNVGIEHVCE